MKDFENIVAEEFPKAVPERFRELLSNVVLLVEDEPSVEVRREQGIEEGETLLGLYTGIPLTERDTQYGMGTMPDTIILYKNPTEEEAEERGGGEEMVRKIIRETIWHEVAHHFGFDDDQVEEREKKNVY